MTKWSEARGHTLLAVGLSQRLCCDIDTLYARIELSAPDAFEKVLLWATKHKLVNRAYGDLILTDKGRLWIDRHYNAEQKQVEVNRITTIFGIENGFHSNIVWESIVGKEATEK